LILGTKLVNSNIPTQVDIQINTTNIQDAENLTFLIKQGSESIAKAFIPMGALRKKETGLFPLQALGNKAESGSNLTWETVFEVEKEIPLQKEMESSQKLENPFEQILLKSGGEFNSEDFGKQSLNDRRFYESQTEREKAHNEAHKNPHTFADLPGGSHQSLTYMEGSGNFQHSSTKIKLDHLLNVLDEKLKEEAAQELPNIGEVNNLFQTLKSSIEELQKDITYGNSPKAHLGDSSVPMEKFLQSAPVYTAKDFAQPDENSSPQFSGDLQKITDKLYHTENLQNVHLKVPVQRERKYSEDSAKGYDIGNIDKLNASGMSRRTSRHMNETGRSAMEDVKIEKNEDYLLTMRNQLTSKNLTFINDQMTRDIILYMAQNKKKISTIRLRRSITIGDKEDVDIDKKEFFNTNCNAKFLHFFQSSSKILYLFNLVQPFELIEEKARKIKMDIDFDISPSHKSVITPAGMIFIAAGKPNFNASNIDIGSNTLHLYNYKGQTLIEKAPMNCKTRSAFGLCYMSKNLFAIGGLVNGQISSNCERYDIRSNKWIKLAPMSRPLREVSVCSFNNRYIYRIFGIDSGNNIDHSIERYDAVRDSWTMMNTTVSPTLKEIYGPFCTQISPDCIFIFGGRNIYGFSPKSCKGWVLRVEEKRGSNNADLIESRNFIPGLAGNFNQNSILTHAGDILFLRESY